MLKQFALRWLSNFVGLLIAARLISGISYDNSLWVIVIASLIFSVANALIRPVIVLLSLPAIIVTVGLFTLIINTFMLYLVTVIYDKFVISTFSAALLAVIIVWLVNYTLNALFRPKEA